MSKYHNFPLHVNTAMRKRRRMHEWVVGCKNCYTRECLSAKCWAAIQFNRLHQVSGLFLWLLLPFDSETCSIGWRNFLSVSASHVYHFQMASLSCFWIKLGPILGSKNLTELRPLTQPLAGIAGAPFVGAERKMLCIDSGGG